MYTGYLNIDDLIGKPYVDGSIGPDSYDCYTLAQEIFYRLSLGFGHPHKHFI